MGRCGFLHLPCHAAAKLINFCETFSNHLTAMFYSRLLECVRSPVLFIFLVSCLAVSLLLQNSKISFFLYSFFDFKFSFFFSLLIPYSLYLKSSSFFQFPENPSEPIQSIFAHTGNACMIDPQFNKFSMHSNVPRLWNVAICRTVNVMPQLSQLIFLEFAPTSSPQCYIAACWCACLRLFNFLQFQICNELCDFRNLKIPCSLFFDFKFIALFEFLLISRNLNQHRFSFNLKSSFILFYSKASRLLHFCLVLALQFLAARQVPNF